MNDAFGLAREICGKMNLPRSVEVGMPVVCWPSQRFGTVGRAGLLQGGACGKDAALPQVRRAVHTRPMTPCRHTSIVAACVYAAARMEGVPRTIKGSIAHAVGTEWLIADRVRDVHGHVMGRDQQVLQGAGQSAAACQLRGPDRRCPRGVQSTIDRPASPATGAILLTHGDRRPQVHQPGAARGARGCGQGHHDRVRHCSCCLH